MITSFERDEKVLRELETIATLSNDYRDGINYSTSNLNLRELETRSPLSNDYKGNSNHSALNLNEPNLTPKSLTSQEKLLKTTENPLKTTQTPLSPLEQANAEKLAKLESERLESGNKIFDFYSDRNITGAGPTQKPPAKQNTILKLAQSQESPLSILEKSQLEKQKKLESGNKIFDFYSNRNFTDFRDARPQPSTSKDSRPLPTTLDEPNLTQKPLTSQENLLKTRENLFITEI